MTAVYDPENIFAKILRGDLPAHRIYEDDHSYAFMDIMPRGDGHCVVIPKAQARNLLDIAPGDLAHLIQTVQHVAKAAVKAFDADGVTIEQFNEPAAGQSVYHLHFHVIPRFEGVALKPHTGTMEKSKVLAAHAEKMIGVLGN
ncbi:HIT family protein [Tianweitania sp. BSSL-BM11]|uniref:HIT family protein n=1 Tax=Tianweitania aestuarii TaxID=2814886 RepID=A0ABS5RUK3_9HYPH|nr:HIT family protein [Tianweitania aestuarii]MBS9720470.1 HIT family protein [Tianweitania aestuarii]